MENELVKQEFKMCFVCKNRGRAISKTQVNNFCPCCGEDIRETWAKAVNGDKTNIQYWLLCHKCYNPIMQRGTTKDIGNYCNHCGAKCTSTHN